MHPKQNKKKEINKKPYKKKRTDDEREEKERKHIFVSKLLPRKEGGNCFFFSNF